MSRVKVYKSRWILTIQTIKWPRNCTVKSKALRSSSLLLNGMMSCYGKRCLLHLYSSQAATQESYLNSRLQLLFLCFVFNKMVAIDNFFLHWYNNLLPQPKLIKLSVILKISEVHLQRYIFALIALDAFYWNVFSFSSCTGWFTVTGRKMDELQDVQLTEIKPLLTNKVSLAEKKDSDKLPRQQEHNSASFVCLRTCKFTHTDWKKKKRRSVCLKQISTPYGPIRQIHMLIHQACTFCSPVHQSELFISAWLCKGKRKKRVQVSRKEKKTLEKKPMQERRREAEQRTKYTPS